MVTLEEGSVCGFGALVMQHLATRGVFDAGLKFRPMCLPDAFIDHDSPRAQYDGAGLSARAIVAQVLAAFGTGTAVAPARA
jgi:1-deoxy-D-xylulose-5-phosphate synthase